MVCDERGDATGRHIAQRNAAEMDFRLLERDELQQVDKVARQGELLKRSTARAEKERKKEKKNDLKIFILFLFC